MEAVTCCIHQFFHFHSWNKIHFIKQNSQNTDVNSLNIPSILGVSSCLCLLTTFPCVFLPGYANWEGCFGYRQLNFKKKHNPKPIYNPNPNLTLTVVTLVIPHVIESVFFEIQINERKTIIVGVVYRPNTQPRVDIDIFMQKIIEIQSKIKEENKVAYLMGDFNIDLLKVNIHAKTNKFVNDVISQGFLPKITRPTRITPHSATLIDHIYSNDNRPTSQKSTSGIIITDVADHFGTFHIVNKCKQPPVQKYSQIRQMKTDNVLRFNNILANADYSSVLLSDCPNYAYHTFMEIYTNAFNQACPVKSIKTPKRYIKREPWVTNGILTSSLTKSKLLKKKPTEQNINAFKKYCIIFDKVKKMAKENYFNLELELNKNNLKKTWEILRQAIHKQNNRPTIPDTFMGHFHKKGQITVKTFWKFDNGITNFLHFIFIAYSLTRCQFM